MPVRSLSYLDRLEAEAIDIMREVVAQAERPVMLYSIGKDSSVLLHLARKAFHPGKLPFPLLHVDTTWKFREMYALPRPHRGRAGRRSARATSTSEGSRQGIGPVHARLGRAHGRDEDRRR